MTNDIRDAQILVLAPHTDDGELGAGGSINKWVTAGNVVHYVAFSACESVQPPSRDPKILRDECQRATAVLGIVEARCRVLDFEVRQFSRDRQSILDAMIALRRELQPDLVVTPTSEDIHQDHAVISIESKRAFKSASILGYEVPWNNFRFDNTAFSVLSEDDMNAKCEALTEYGSQDDRPYMRREYQEAHLRYRGLQANTTFAEAFEVLRWYL